MMKTQNARTVSAVSSIRIHGKKFNIKPFEDVAASHDKLGYNDVRVGIIQYDPKSALDVIKDTFLHEIIHVLDYDAQLGLEEKQVHALATGLYSVLKDNPDLAKWLIK